MSGVHILRNCHSLDISFSKKTCHNFVPNIDKCLSFNSTGNMEQWVYYQFWQRTHGVIMHILPEKLKIYLKMKKKHRKLTSQRNQTYGHNNTTNKTRISKSQMIFLVYRHPDIIMCNLLYLDSILKDGETNTLYPFPLSPWTPMLKTLSYYLPLEVARRK